MDTATGSGNKIIKTYYVSVTYEIIFTRFRWVPNAFIRYLPTTHVYVYVPNFIFSLGTPAPQQPPKNTEREREKKNLLR